MAPSFSVIVLTEPAARLASVPAAIVTSLVFVLAPAETATSRPFLRCSVTVTRKLIFEQAPAPAGQESFSVTIPLPPESGRERCRPAVARWAPWRRGRR